MTGPTTTSIVPPAVPSQMSMKLLARPMPDLIYTCLGYPITMDQNAGGTLVRRRYNNWPTAPVPLGNGIVNPAPQQFTAVDIPATIDWYGQFGIVQEQVILLSEDPVLNAYVSVAGQALRETEDQLARSMMEGQAPTINAVYGGGSDSPTPISFKDLGNVHRMLRGANAQYIMDQIEGENKFGTSPVRYAFFGLCSTDLMPDLDNMDEFDNVANYSSDKNLLPAEFGTAGNFRFLCSSVGSRYPNASALGNDVYPIFFPGQESYDMVDLDGYSAQMIYSPPEIASPQLRLYQTLGWKAALVFNITNTSWILGLNVTLGQPLP